MKINSEFLITKVELRKKTSDGSAYLLISLLDLKTGDLFEVMHKNIEDMQKIQAMNKQDVTLNLTNTKFGLKLEITNIGEILGSI